MSGTKSLRSLGPRRAIVVSAGLLAVIAAFLLRGQWLLYKERQATLAQRLNDVREDVRKLEAVAAKLAEFRQRFVLQLEGRLDSVRKALPEQLDASAVEAEVKGVARAAGLRVASISVATAQKAEHSEATLNLSVEGSRAAVERFMGRVVGLPRLYRVDDVFLPGPKGKIRLRAFAKAETDRPPALDECVDPPADAYPPWLFSLTDERQQLEVACARRQQLEVIRKQVHEYQAKELYREEAMRLVDGIRAMPPARIATELGASQLTVAELRLGAVGMDGQTPVARVAVPGAHNLRLRASDRLADGVVKSVAKDHVIVETEVTAANAKLATRLLRFTPSQTLPPITLGHDTTRITKPLLADGTPDYGTWLNDKYSDGVTAANNAAVPLNVALGGLVDAGQTFFDELSRDKRQWRPWRAPWLEKDCSSCAARLERNGKPLTALAEAVRRTRYFVRVPSGARLSDSWFPSLLRLRVAGNALAGRGMLQLGRGEVKRSAEDALAGQRLALLVAQSPTLIQRLIGIAIRGIAAPLLPRLASASSLGPSAARDLLSELRTLPQMPGIAESLDDYERFQALEQMLLLRQRAAERGAGGMIEVLEQQWLGQIEDSWRVDAIVCLIPASAFDWDEALRLVNRGFDHSLAVVQASTPAERRRTRAAAEAEGQSLNRQAKAVLETLKKGVRSEQTEPADIAETAEALARTTEGRKRLAHLLVPRDDLLRASVAWNEMEALFRLGVTSVALSAHRLEAGGYPASLDALVAGLLPGRFAPSSPLPGYVLSYQAARATAGPGAYALTAVPEEKGVTGNRGFCVDSTGAMRSPIDGTAPKIANGICDPQVPLLR